MDKKELQKVISKAVAWLATEHNYFLELKKDIFKLKTDIERAKSNADLKGLRFLLRDVRYIGKAERRFNRYEHNVESILSKAKDKIKVSGTITEVEELIRRLHLEAADLVNSSSMYEGRLRDLLVQLQAAIKSKELEQAHQCLMELAKLAENTEKWIAALSTDLNGAKKLSEEFDQIYGDNLEEIHAKLRCLQPEAQFNYLIGFVKHKKSLPKETYEGIVSILMSLIVGIGKKEHLAEAFEKVGDWERAGPCWERVANWWKSPYNYSKYHEYDRGNYYDCKLKAINAFEKAGKLEVALELGLELEKRGGLEYKTYLKIIEILNRIGQKDKAKELELKLAQSYFSNGKLRLCLKTLQKTGLNEHDVQRQLGIWYERSDQYGKAANIFEKIGEWKLLGDVWNSVGEGAKAMEAYRKAKK